MWFVLALLSALFAALTSILAKIGINGVNSNLATAIRTMVVVVMAWGMVFLTHSQSGISSIGKKSWIFLILSGLATGASWLCYYKALQVGDASKVVPVDKLSVIITLILAFVFLHEDFTAKSLIGLRPYRRRNPSYGFISGTPFCNLAATLPQLYCNLAATLRQPYITLHIEPTN